MPADSSNALAVGAVPWNNPTTIESFSSRGPTTDNRTKPDLVAPDGVTTATADPFTGTSAATPHVAGAAVLVKQAYPSYTPAQIQSYLENNAVDLGDTGKDNIYGSGRLQLPLTLNFTFYPSLDGLVGQAYSGYGAAWFTIRGAGGSESIDNWVSQDAVQIAEYGGYSPNYWYRLRRSIFLFDTSSLPDSGNITEATLSIRGMSKSNSVPNAVPKLNVYSSNPSSSSALAAGDFDSLGTTAFSSDKAYTDWNVTGYMDFALNSSGIAAISKTGLSKFGLREAVYDAGGQTPPSPTGDQFINYALYFVEKGEGYKPKLTITCSLP